VEEMSRRTGNGSEETVFLAGFFYQLANLVRFDLGEHVENTLNLESN
jgi:hypothetical protein